MSWVGVVLIGRGCFEDVENKQKQTAWRRSLVWSIINGGWGGCFLSCSLPWSQLLSGFRSFLTALLLKQKKALVCVCGPIWRRGPGGIALWRSDVLYTINNEWSVFRCSPFVPTMCLTLSGVTCSHLLSKPRCLLVVGDVCVHIHRPLLSLWPLSAWMVNLRGRGSDFPQYATTFPPSARALPFWIYRIIDPSSYWLEGGKRSRGQELKKIKFMPHISKGLPIDLHAQYISIRSGGFCNRSLRGRSSRTAPQPKHLPKPLGCWFTARLGAAIWHKYKYTVHLYASVRW